MFMYWSALLKVKPQQCCGFGFSFWKTQYHYISPVHSVFTKLILYVYPKLLTFHMLFKTL